MAELQKFPSDLVTREFIYILRFTVIEQIRKSALPLVKTRVSMLDAFFTSSEAISNESLTEANLLNAWSKTNLSAIATCRPFTITSALPSSNGWRIDAKDFLIF